MKNVPSNAIENGFTAQLMNSVTPTPRARATTPPRAPKSILSSIGMIISQMSTAMGRLTFATSQLATVAKTPGMMCPRATPTIMHNATHSVRNRSKMPMACLASRRRF